MCVLLGTHVTDRGAAPLVHVAKRRPYVAVHSAIMALSLLVCGQQIISDYPFECGNLKEKEDVV
jgi:hypothetical protein